MDLFVLPLSSAELVLGVQWLKSLGPVLTDHDKLTLTFVRDGYVIQFHGSSKPELDEASIHQLKRMVSTNSIDTMLELHLISPSAKPTLHPPHATWLEPLLDA